MDILTLDGSHGEGGGQILRTALSLSAHNGATLPPREHPRRPTQTRTLAAALFDS
jgi:hypothetical protein